jgi:DMSO/TMAO reductase YedYZ molybdopterin-dependent catalytic subunit
VAGTRPEITPIADFYRVDINLLPPGDAAFLEGDDSLTQRLLAQGGETELPETGYRLQVGGLVERPLALSLADLKSYPMVEQYATLACISNPIGGDLISTTLFQGARLKDVLEDAGLLAEAADLKFTSVDGYTESLPIESALDPRTLLCYAMGGQPLTREHGFPLRLYTPDRFGMKNPKWIIKIEAVAEDYLGFWEQRGWSEDAWVQTTSVIDAIQDTGTRMVEVGGIAFAGARGIKQVELRIDEGEWIAAEMNRALSQLTWVLWKAQVELSPGRHRLTVRATDGSGVVQTEERSPTHPDGATGYHSRTITIP